MFRPLNYFHHISNIGVLVGAKSFRQESWRCVQYKNILNPFLIKRTFALSCLNYQHPANNKEIKPEEKKNIENGPGLEYFISKTYTSRELKNISHPYLKIDDLHGNGRKVFFNVYGCQMNVNDTDIAWAVLKQHGYQKTNKFEEADVILIVTCSIREGAENKIWTVLQQLRGYKSKNKKRGKVKIGVLGCMAERLKKDLLEKENAVDIVAGPDSYRDLPRLLAITYGGEKAVNVLLSHDETYADITPISISPNNVSAYVSIMRGCDNMCTYCIVPFTRGKERSRNVTSIIDEVKYLSEEGIKEITLVGQNVNSYRDTSEICVLPNDAVQNSFMAKDFSTVYKPKTIGKRFADLLDKVSLINPEMRIRFVSPHPKDFPDEVLHMIKERSNICSHLHLPAQSGNSRILELMRRGYTREAYIQLVQHIRSIIPNVTLTSDFICGFCTETDEEFEDTVSLLKLVKYNFCYIFPYSLREKTAAHRKYKDSVPQDIKNERSSRLHLIFRELSEQVNSAQIGQHHLVLVEGRSKRSSKQLSGRNDGNTKVIIPDIEIPVVGSAELRNARAGDYVEVLVTEANSQVLLATPVAISSLVQFSRSLR